MTDKTFIIKVVAGTCFLCAGILLSEIIKRKERLAILNILEELKQPDTWDDTRNLVEERWGGRHATRRKIKLFWCLFWILVVFGFYLLYFFK